MHVACLAYLSGMNKTNGCNQYGRLKYLSRHVHCPCFTCFLLHTSKMSSLPSTDLHTPEEVDTLCGGGQFLRWVTLYMVVETSWGRWHFLWWVALLVVSDTSCGGWHLLRWVTLLVLVDTFWGGWHFFGLWHFLRWVTLPEVVDTSLIDQTSWGGWHFLL